MITYDYCMQPYLWRRANRAHAETGKAPISLRIEIAGYPRRSELSTGVQATEAEWNSAAQRLQPLRGMSKEDLLLQKSHNAKLSKLLLQLDQAYNNYKSQGGDPAPAELRELLRGGKSQRAQLSLLSAMEMRYLLLSEKQRQPSTLLNMRKAIDAVVRYLKESGQQGMMAHRADRHWCRGFERWMLGIPYLGSTIRDYFGQLFSALHQATDEGLVKEFPAAGYRFLSERVVAPKRHLSQEEVQRLSSFQFSSKTLARVRQLFVFCCRTGLSYVDYRRFASAPLDFISYQPDAAGRLVKGFDLMRQKMSYRGTAHWVPLLPEADALLVDLWVYEKTYINKKLKLIAQQVALSLSDLSHKDARSTFAQYMREQTNRNTSAAVLMHSEEISQAHYTKESAVVLLKKMAEFNVPLVYLSNPAGPEPAEPPLQPPQPADAPRYHSFEQRRGLPVAEPLAYTPQMPNTGRLPLEILQQA